MIEFTIPFQVKPKQSTRFGKHCYPDAKVKRNADSLAALMAQYAPSEPMQGPVSLTCWFMYPWRKSEPKKNRSFRTRPKDTKPDLDNLVKQVCDVMESCGFIVNDSQIAEKNARKMWGEAPILTVRINELQPNAFYPYANA